MAKKRLDHEGPYRMDFLRNKKKILQSQDVCAICGRPVDKTLKFPDKMAATVDHIIPVAKGGHPSDITNLQLAHFICNRLKSDKIYESQRHKENKIYQSMDWKTF